MKIVLFGGGLGNQIFEYAFYRYLKRTFPKTSIHGIYNKKWLKDHNGLEVNKVFDIKLPEESIYSTFITYILYLIKKIYPKTKLCSLNMNEANLKAVFFNAYKPNKKYYEDQVNWIKFREPVLNNLNKDTLNSIINSESVSIHIRRGDYFNPDLKDTYGGICTIEYYEKAINILKSFLSNPQFYIFSDDIEWVKTHMDIEKAQFITWNKKENSYLDMYLMTYCKANIIANSTFSYWGAYLNKRTKMVIYPKKWVNREKIPNIFPESWIGI